MSQLVLATRNKGKLKEIQSLLSGIPFEIISVEDFAEVPEVEEDGATMEDNALKKARTVFSFTHLPTLSDDSGLEVYALGMRPGVISARYSGEGATYASNNKKLLLELNNVPPENRRAQFRCVVAYVTKDLEQTFEGVCEGTILTEQRGIGGFGYDPLFLPNGYNQTFAELPLDVKNKISHRAKAFNLIKNRLISL